MSDQIQQIKDRVGIVEVVGQYVKLTKAGRNYKGLSPFKKEKTPSFYVSPDKGMYYDFSSGQGGDIFSFVQHMEGLDFKGALTLLADRAGVVLVHENKGNRDMRERLYGALEDACAFFQTKLAEQPDACAYLHERGVHEVTTHAFRLGFAPDGWQVLRDFLEGKGYRMAELEQAGLVKKGDRGSYYDRFRSRIMFPIMDPAGRVIAFSGRIFGTPADDPVNAKYLNSPETPLFDKGRVLYGYHIAKQYMRTYDCAILVEGQMDIVMSHQVGYTNTVAVSGTGLTDEHLALIQRLTNNVVLAFDADSAGLASSGRAAMLALARGMEVKVSSIPYGKDPADCIKTDVQAWKHAVKNSLHVVDYMLTTVIAQHARDGNTDERALILAVRDTVFPYIARIRGGVHQAHFVRRVAQALGLSEDAVREDVRNVTKELTSATKNTSSEDVHTSKPLTHEPIAPVITTRKEMSERALAGFLFWQETLEPRLLEDGAVTPEAERLSVDVSSILARWSGQREVIALEAEITYAHSSTTTQPEELLGILLAGVAREYKQEELDCAIKELRLAEHGADEVKSLALLARINELSRCIDTLAR